MLVLSRHKDEEVLIGDAISVIVVDIRGDKVRLGIQAPKEVPVHRREVYDAIMRESKKATKIAEANAPDIREVQRRLALAKLTDTEKQLLGLT